MVINKRCRHIILDIIIKERTKVSDLAKKYKVSERTIRSDLDEIDYFLKKSGFLPLMRSEKHEILIENQKEKISLIYGLINLNDMVIASYSKHERLLELMYLLTNTKETLKIDSLANILQVSKSTVVKDLERLRKYLLEDVELIGTYEGIRLSGSELWIRISMLQLYFSNMDSATIKMLVSSIRGEIKTTYEVYWHLFENSDISFIQKCVRFIQNALSKEMSDYDMLYCLAAFVLLTKRNGYMNNIATCNLLNYKKRFSIDLVEYLLTLYEEHYPKEKFLDGEKQYLFYICTICNKDLLISEHMETFYELKKFIDLFKEKMLKKEHFQLNEKELERSIQNLYIDNKLHYIEYRDVIGLKKSEYLEVWNNVVFYWNEMEGGWELTKDDYWRISWHFIKGKKCSKKKKQVLIVSDKPSSLIHYLVEDLNAFFELEIIGICGISGMRDYLKIYDVDYIISTVEVETEKQVLKVHPLLETSEIIYLKKYLDTHKVEKRNKECEWKYKSSYKEYKDIDDFAKAAAIFLQKCEATSTYFMPLIKEELKNVQEGWKFKDRYILSLKEHVLLKKNVVYRGVINSLGRIDLVACCSKAEYLEYIDLLYEEV